MSNMVRVTVGGSFACDEALAQPLQLILREVICDVDASIDWMPYGSVQEPTALQAQLTGNTSHLVVLLVRLIDLCAAHPELGASDAANETLQARFVQTIGSLASKDNAPPIIIILCPEPELSPPVDPEQQASLNEFTAAIGALRNVQVVPSARLVDFLSDEHRHFHDPVGDRRQHTPYKQPMLNTIALIIARQICRLCRPIKKVIALDCDNTLWGGAIAELGPSGIALTEEFVALQRFMVKQQQQGMLLCLCSKNIEKDVVEGFRARATDFPLDLDTHIVQSKVNWQSKSENLQTLAKELSLGLDSFIFVDDNPLECSEVSLALPAVSVVRVPASFSPTFMRHQWIFDPPIQSRQPTAEDAGRTLMYKQNLQRTQLEHGAATRAAFLSSLGVRIHFEEVHAAGESFDRVLQLHQRTNQFNPATTASRVLTASALQAYIEQPDHTVVCAHVTDRFGHYGLVSVALVRRSNRDSTVCSVDSFLVSCRALNRGVEHAMVRQVAACATALACTEIEFPWEPTERNEPARQFFSTLAATRFCSNNDDTHDPSRHVQDKNAQSAKFAGKWCITVDDAAAVSFLKDEQQRSANALAPTTTSSIVSWGWSLAQSTVGWLRLWPRSTWLRLEHKPFFRWLLRPLLRTNCNAPSIARGLPRVPIESSGALAALLRPHLPSKLTEELSSTTVSSDTIDVNEDCKFRRKARHQSKLALIDHLADESVKVIWTANPTTGGDNDDVNEAPADAGPSDVVRFQIACATDTCTVTISRDSGCSFTRCSGCCYRIQRLLSRARHPSTDPRPQHQAMTDLHSQFGVDHTQHHPQSVGAHVWCGVHTNRKRLFKS